MHIKELTIAEFDNYSKTHMLGSYYQSSNYALLMAEKGYEYDLIGYVDELGIIKATALILIKKIDSFHKYGYSPKGFLIDYFDYDLLKSFSNALKEYYNKKLVFIKINPEIAISEIDKRTKISNYNQNITIRGYLKDLGYNKLKDNIYFESIFPRYNAIINLEEYNFNKLDKNTKNKIRKAEKKGLVFEIGNHHYLNQFFEFIKNKKETEPFYYNNYYNVFKDKNDLLLVKIDYEKYLINSKKLYDKEMERNAILTEKLAHNSSETIIKQKMNSDKTLLSYKNDIELATHYLKQGKEKYIAGAFIIKYNNRINIVISGIDKKYKSFNANYFLHYNILEYYKANYKFVDLNGIAGDFTKNNPYEGLNNFKLGFNPHIYEFIGEFDFVINEKNYKHLIKRGILAREFNK